MNSERIYAATMAVRSWLESNDFAGWDPFDLLNSPLLRPISARSRVAGVALIQLGKRSPLNLRAVLRVPRVRNAKTIGLALSAYLRLREISGTGEYDKKIVELASWLAANRSQGYSAACWGYPFDWPNRSFVAVTGTPSVVTTYFCASPLLELAAQQLVASNLKVPGVDPLVLARSSCDFVTDNLNRIPGNEGEPYFGWSYTPLDKRQIHNASLFGARLLAQVGAVTSEPKLTELALASAYYTAKRQRSDASWPYGEDRRNSWVDNFHTAYVVSSLLSISKLLGDQFLQDVALKGYSYWAGSFFAPDGAPKWGPKRTFPIDIHNCAQAINTFLDFTGHDPKAVESARRVAAWTLDNMQASDGEFIYQRHRAYAIRTVYTRWSQAWMFNALATLLSRVDTTVASS